MKTLYNICLITLSLTVAFTLASCKAGGGNKTAGAAAGVSDGDGYDSPDVVKSGEGIVFVDGATGSDTGNNGTMTSPYKTVSKGIKVASGNSYKVYVAQGTYTVESEGGNITLAEGVSVYGGYSNNSGEWTRQTNHYTTSIQNVVAGSGITSATVVDGFTISAKAGASVVAVYCNGGSPTISNNTINGAPVLVPYSLIKTAQGIYLVDSSAVISNNKITGGVSDRESNGIFCKNSSPLIGSNIVAGGKSLNSYGIQSQGSSNPEINNNQISSSGMKGSSGIAVVKSEANPAAMNNNRFLDSLTPGNSSDEKTLFLSFPDMKEYDVVSAVNDFPFASGNL